MAILVRDSGAIPGFIPGWVGCDGWVSVTPGLRGSLCLSFLCPKTISVVFCGGTGIYTGWVRIGAS